MSLAPTYWGPHERKRLPWNPNAVVERVLAKVSANSEFYAGSVELWRTRSPKWQGWLTVGDMSVNRLVLEVGGILTEERCRQIYSDLSEIVLGVPIFAGWITQFHGGGREDGGQVFADQRSAGGHYISAGHDTVTVHKCGLPSLGYRTWFGKLVAERVGVDRIEHLPHVTRLRDDLFQIDLGAAPWALSLEQATRAFYSAMDLLMPSGMFYVGAWDQNYIGAHGKPVPCAVFPSPTAPNWTPPDWIVSRFTKDAAIASGKIEAPIVQDIPVVRVAPMLPSEWLMSRATGSAAQGGDVSGLDLREADLSRIKANGPLLNKCDLRGVPFVEFSALRARFEDANAEGADFREAHLMESSFSRANLKAAFFTGATLHICGFLHADLEGADFCGADLEASFTTGANLRNAVFRKVRGRWMELDDSNLAGADFTEAVLVGADFSSTVTQRNGTVGAEAAEFRRGLSTTRCFSPVVGRVESVPASRVRRPSDGRREG